MSPIAWQLDSMLIKKNTAKYDSFFPIKKVVYP